MIDIYIKISHSQHRNAVTSLSAVAMGDILPYLIPSGLPHPHCSNFCIKLKSNIKFYVVVCSNK